jgi:hypothetical protein
MGTTATNAPDDLAGALDPADLGALAAQGFVSAETRPSGAVTYKLRWRRAGRQRVRYLGSDPAAAAAVRAALANLQAPARAGRAAAGLLRRARAALARAKAVLAPALAAKGYHYHGYASRRGRPAAGNGPAPESNGVTHE